MLQIFLAGACGARDAVKQNPEVAANQAAASHEGKAAGGVKEVSQTVHARQQALRQLVRIGVRIADQPGLTAFLAKSQQPSVGGHAVGPENLEQAGRQRVLAVTEQKLVLVRVMERQINIGAQGPPQPFQGRARACRALRQTPFQLAQRLAYQLRQQFLFAAVKVVNHAGRTSRSPRDGPDRGAFVAALQKQVARRAQDTLADGQRNCARRFTA